MINTENYAIVSFFRHQTSFGFDLAQITKFHHFNFLIRTLHTIFNYLPIQVYWLYSQKEPLLFQNQVFYSTFIPYFLYFFSVASYHFHHSVHQHNSAR